MEEANTPKFEHYVEATRQVVEEFRDVLAEHHAGLVHYDIELNKGQGPYKGASVVSTKASDDPQHAAHVHRMRLACDQFLNALNGQY
jgi:hypothetical protein